MPTPDERLDRIEDKLDRALDVLTEVRVTLATNTVILAEHQRRSLALETIVDVLRSRPHKARTISWTSVAKLAATVTGAGGAVGAVLKALGKL